MAAGSIIIDLLMRTGSFETDTKRAQKALREMQRDAEQMGKAFGLAVAAAGTVAALFVRNAIDSADAMSKMAQKVGIGTEQLSELAFAAKLSDVGFEDLGASMVKFAKGISDAARGTGDAAKAFEAMGIGVQNADGSLKSQATLLAEVAEKFAGYEDGVEKTALAVATFGKAGANMIPLLNGGAEGLRSAAAEARALGAVLTGDAGKAAEAFNDNLTRLKTAFLGLVNQITVAMLPRMVDVTNAFVDFVKDGDRVHQMAMDIGDALAWVARTAADTASYIAGVVARTQQLGMTAAAIVAVKDKLTGPSWSDATTGVVAEFRRWREEMAQSDKALAELQARMEKFGGFGRGGAGSRAMAASLGIGDIEKAAGPSLVKPSAPRLPSEGGGAGRSEVDKAAQYLERLRKQLEATQELTVAEKLLQDIRDGALGTVTAAQEKSLMATAREIDATKEAIRIARERSDARKREDEEIAASIAQAQEADRQRLKSLTAGTSSEQLKAVTADIGFLNEAYAAGKIEVDLWAEAVVLATGRLKAQAEEMDSFTKVMAENVQSFLGSAFADAMNGNFKSIGQAFTQMINRMVAEALAADLARRLFGSAVKGGEGGGWIGAAFDWGAKFFGGGKAAGGDVMPGRSYWVGEQGPERFVPRTAGTILPAARAAGGGGGSLVVNNQFTISGPVDRRTQMQIASEVSRRVRLAGARVG